MTFTWDRQDRTISEVVVDQKDGEWIATQRLATFTTADDIGARLLDAAILTLRQEGCSWVPPRFER